MAKAGTNYAVSSKRVKSVTWLPGWMLKLKGRIGSRHGQETCSEYIEKLNKHLSSMEGREVTGAENSLFSLRKEAEIVIAGISEKIAQFVEIPEDRKDISVESIRKNRANSIKFDSIKNEIILLIKRLAVINETIVNTDTVLDERINRLRKNAEEKIHAYVSGILCGKLKNWNYEILKKEYDNAALDIYIGRHQALDNQIAKMSDITVIKEEAVKYGIIQ